MGRNPCRIYPVALRVMPFTSYARVASLMLLAAAATLMPLADAQLVPTTGVNYGTSTD